MMDRATTGHDRAVRPHEVREMRNRRDYLRSGRNTTLRQAGLFEFGLRDWPRM